MSPKLVVMAGGVGHLVYCGFADVESGDEFPRIIGYAGEARWRSGEAVHLLQQDSR